MYFGQQTIKKSKTLENLSDYWSSRCPYVDRAGCVQQVLQ